MDLSLSLSFFFFFFGGGGEGSTIAVALQILYLAVAKLLSYSETVLDSFTTGVQLRAPQIKFRESIHVSCIFRKGCGTFIAFVSLYMYTAHDLQKQSNRNAT